MITFLPQVLVWSKSLFVIFYDQKGDIVFSLRCVMKLKEGMACSVGNVFVSLSFTLFLFTPKNFCNLQNVPSLFSAVKLPLSHLPEEETQKLTTEFEPLPLLLHTLLVTNTLWNRANAACQGRSEERLRFR